MAGGLSSVAFSLARAAQIPTPIWDTPVINVRRLGALGDGITDDTAAINSAIGEFNSVGGVLQFPFGSYLCSSSLTPVTASGLILGQGRSSAYREGIAPTTILCSSPTASLFTVNSALLSFRDLDIKNVSQSAPTSGAGITVTSGLMGQCVSYEDLSVFGFYNNIDSQTGGYWTMENCSITGAVNFGLFIRNINNVDAGDWCISNSMFATQNFNTIAAIKQQGSGGGKIMNCKFNTSVQQTNFLVDCINSDLSGTRDFLVTNCSFENYSNSAITLGHAGQVTLSNLQIAPGGLPGNTGGGSAAIIGTSIQDSVISNIVAQSPFVFNLSGCSNMKISNIVVVGGSIYNPASQQFGT